MKPQNFLDFHDGQPLLRQVGTSTVSGTLAASGLSSVPLHLNLRFRQPHSLSTIRSERCSTSLRNHVRHHVGIMFAITSESCSPWLGFRNSFGKRSNS